MSVASKEVPALLLGAVVGALGIAASVGAQLPTTPRVSRDSLAAPQPTTADRPAPGAVVEALVPDAPVTLSVGVRGWPTPAGAARGVVAGARARYDARWWRVRADASLTQSQAAGGGTHLLDGRALLSTAPLQVSAFGTLFGADAAAGVERDAYDPRGTWAQRGGRVRAWAGGPGRGVWGGVGATAPSNPHATPAATEWQVGAWARPGWAVVSAVVQGVATSRLDPIPRDSSNVVPGSCYVQYDATREYQQSYSVCPKRLGSADAVLGLAWRWGATTLQARVGRRLGAQLSASAPGRGWAGAGVVLPPVGPLALGLDYVRRPADVVRGIPATSRFFAGLRWAPPRRTTDASPTRTAVRGAPGAPAGMRVLAFALGPAASAEVEGDFTAWRPVPLERGADGTWSALVALAPGLHTLRVRVDGGPWQVPPGLASADDDFGGVVGTLVVDAPVGDPAPAPRASP